MMVEKTYELDGKEYLIQLSFGDWSDKFKLMVYERLYEHRRGGAGKWKLMDVNTPPGAPLQERMAMRLQAMLNVIKPEWIEELKSELIEEIKKSDIRG